LHNFNQVIRSFLLSVVLLFVLTGMAVGQTIPDTLNRIDEKGHKQGYWKKYNEMGLLMYEGRFENDVPVGDFIYYFPDDIVKARSVFSDNGKRTFTITYHHSGKVMTEGYYFEKKKDSTWKYYDIDEHLLKIEFYRNNKKAGIWKVYYENGNLAEETGYKNDFKDGIWKQYYEDSTLKATGSFENGERHGPVEYYYPDSRVQLTGTYEHSLRVGEWFYYDENSKVIRKEIYNDEGKLIKEKDYGEPSDNQDTIEK